MYRDKLEYLFLRLKIAKADEITAELNRYGDEGWVLISHSEDQNEYSFTLVREKE